MKTNGHLHRYYGRLTPAERFRLTVEARARSDASEERRLVESCPRKTYTETDFAFAGRLSAAEEITLYFCLDLYRHTARLQVLSGLIEARIFPEEPEGLLERLCCGVCAEGLAVWRGYAAFCQQELRLEPDKLLRASFAPAAEAANRLTSLAAGLGIEPDSARAEEYRSVLVEIWRRKTAGFEEVREG